MLLSEDFKEYVGYLLENTEGVSIYDIVDDILFKLEHDETVKVSDIIHRICTVEYDKVENPKRVLRILNKCNEFAPDLNTKAIFDYLAHMLKTYHEREYRWSWIDYIPIALPIIAITYFIANV
jgi:hypothetical protein